MKGEGNEKEGRKEGRREKKEWKKKLGFCSY